MKNRRASVAVILGIFLLTNTSSLSLAADTVPTSDRTEYVVTVKSAETVVALTDEDKEDVVDSGEAAVMEEEQTYVLSLTETEAAQLENDENVMYIEKNILFMVESQQEKPPAEDMVEEETMVNISEEYQKLEDDPDLPLTVKLETDDASWNRTFIHAETNEVGGNQGKGIRIAVLDSGASISENLPVEAWVDLAGNEIEDPLNLHYDVTGHGTGVTGVIADISPEASIYAVRIFDEDNEAPLSRVIAGIQWAVQNDMDIINMSFGTEIPSEILHHIIREAYDAGILLVAAAGNTGESDGQMLYPAAYEEVVSVGSVDGRGNLSDFSADRKAVEILAPGEGIITNGLFDGYMSVNGTSIAAPHVTGAAALLWSAEPEADSEYIRSLLETSANRSVFSDNNGAGILDAGNAYTVRKKFSENYSPEKKEYMEVLDTRGELGTFDSDVIVEGCWAKTKHAEMLFKFTGMTDDFDGQKVTTGEMGNVGMEFSGRISLKNIKLMARTAYMADVYYDINQYKRFYPLHAFGYTSGVGSDTVKGMNNNYVADLKYLYRLARFYMYYDEMHGTNNTSLSTVDAVINASGFSEIAKSKANDVFLRAVVSSSKPLSGTNAKGIVHQDTITGYEESGLEEAGWKILGLAAHMAGDIYAHRTRVPLSCSDFSRWFVKENKFYTQPHSSSEPVAMKDFLKNERAYISEYGSLAAVEVCRCESCVRNAVKDGLVEFRDIYYLTKVENIDDSTTYYKQRYNIATQHAVRTLISQFLQYDPANKKTGDFTIHVLLPPESTGYTLKLNNLKGCILDTNTNWDGLSTSTQNLVEKYSTGKEI